MPSIGGYHFTLVGPVVVNTNKKYQYIFKQINIHGMKNTNISTHMITCYFSHRCQTFWASSWERFSSDCLPCIQLNLRKPWCIKYRPLVVCVCVCVCECSMWMCVCVVCLPVCVCVGNKSMLSWTKSWHHFSVGYAKKIWTVGEFHQFFTGCILYMCSYLDSIVSTGISLSFHSRIRTSILH